MVLKVFISGSFVYSKMEEGRFSKLCSIGCK